MKRIILISVAVLVAALFSVGQSLGAGDYGAKDQGAMKQDHMQGAVSLNNEQITEVQKILSNKGFDPGPVDGIIGERTRSALREFQEEEGLSVTGEADIITLRALAPDTETQEMLGISPKFEEESGMVEPEQEEQMQKKEWEEKY